MPFPLTSSRTHDEHGRAYALSAVLSLDEGDAGTMQTLEMMQAVTEDAVNHSPAVQQLAARIAALAPRDAMQQLRILYDWFGESVSFKRDTFAREHLRHPDQLLAEIGQHGRTAADCDDLAMLAASIMSALGMKAAFVVVSKRRDSFQHVFTAARVAGRWVWFDPQERVPLGEKPRGVVRQRMVRALP